MSPRLLNVGYGTPFHSSSQFFSKPDRQNFLLPAPNVSAQHNILVGLGLPNTPAFQDINDPSQRRNALQSRHSNPFEQRNQANLNMGVPSNAYSLSHNPDTNPDSNHSNHPNRGSRGGGGGGGNYPSGGEGANRQLRWRPLWESGWRK